GVLGRPTQLAFTWITPAKCEECRLRLVSQTGVLFSLSWWKRENRGQHADDPGGRRWLRRLLHGLETGKEAPPGGGAGHRRRSPAVHDVSAVPAGGAGRFGRVPARRRIPAPAPKQDEGHHRPGDRDRPRKPDGH